MTHVCTLKHHTCLFPTFFIHVCTLEHHTLLIILHLLYSRASAMGVEEDFASAAEDISNNVNKTLSDDELKEV